MLVEDDNNLREIYEARLAAEGYEIVSAHDGEEALALAVKEQPDLIISDIMMPKISGFDMLDILRSTPETRDCKIVMMTALSQAEDKERAGKLGADKYLVKSQVTLEDVVRVAQELLQAPAATPAAVTDNTPADDTTPTPAPVAPAATSDTTDVPVASEPVAATPASDTPVAAPVAAPVPDDTAAPAAPITDVAAQTSSDDSGASAPASSDTADNPAAKETPAPDTGSTADPEPSPTAEPTASSAASVEDQIRDFISTAEQVKNNTNTPAPAQAVASTQIPVTDGAAGVTSETAAAPAATPEAAPAAPVEPQLATPSGQKKVIEPINDLSKPGPDLEALLAKEEAKESGVSEASPSVNTVISPDGTLSYATPPPTADEAPAASADEPAEPLATPPPATDDNTPHTPGQKIDPDSVAL